MKKNIIVVEDNKTELKVFSRIMSHIDCNVFELSSGKEVLDFLDDKLDIKVKKKNVSLFLIDFYLQDSTADLLIRRIRENNIPVAILSRDKNMNNIVSSLKEGAENFFIKGDEVEFDRLHKFIKELR